MSKQSHKTHNKAFIAGSAHLDVLGSATGDSGTIDKVGGVNVSVGGTGGNIAVNLARMGVESIFMSAANESPFSRLVEHFLVSNQVRPVIERRADLSNAIFSAHVSAEGEMLSAVSSMPVEKVAFEPESIEYWMRGCDLAIADCNLSVLSLNNVVRAANDQNIPVFVAGVSEEKAMRAAAITAPYNALFVNRREAEYLRANLYPAAKDDVSLARAVGTALVITEGARGAVVAMGDTAIRVRASVVREATNFLGSGDALLAATTYFHAVRGEAMNDAAFYAGNFIEQVIASGACNLSDFHLPGEVFFEAEVQATYDRATGFFTRARMQDHLDQAFIEGRKQKAGVALGIIMVKVPEFRATVATFGEEVGKAIIATAAGAVGSALNQNCQPALWGDGCFLIAMATASPLLLNERVRALQSVRALKGVPIPVSLQIAACIKSEHHKNAVDLVSECESEMDMALAMEGSMRVSAWAREK